MRKRAAIIFCAAIGCGTDPEGMLAPPPPRDLSCASHADCEANESCKRVVVEGLLKTECRIGASGGGAGDACSGLNDCRSDLCLDLYCADPCDGTCPTGMVCETQRIESLAGIMDLPMCIFRVVSAPLELGLVATPLEGSRELSIEVPAGLAAFTVTLIDDDHLRVAVRSLIAPDGTSFLDITDQELDPNPATNYIGAATLMVPSSDDPRFGVAPGAWKLRVGTFDPENFGELDPVAGEIEQILVNFEPLEEAGGKFDLTFHFSRGTGVLSTTATSSEFVRDLLEQVESLLAEPAGITLGDLRYNNISDEHDVVEDGDETRALCAMRSQPGPHRASINVFVVADLSYTSGHSGGIPLAPALYGTPASGIVIEKLGSGRDTGILLAHELGHSLGLRHTTELDGKPDPVLDTPFCASGTSIENCPDYLNLMFPVFPLDEDLRLTPGQISVLRGHPALYDL